MEKLRTYIAESGITQSALARAVGVYPASITRYLAGDNVPSIATALAIERATGGAVKVGDWA